METFGNIIKKAREDRSLLLRQVAAKLEIDQSLVSKFENGDRRPNKEQVEKFANLYDLSLEDLLIAWRSDKIVCEIRYDVNANVILKVAEEKINYLKRQIF